jgi:dihydropteroate synthase
MAVAATAAEASSAVDAGADLVDLTGAAPAEVATFRRAHPGVPVCADGGDTDLTRDSSVAAASGARLICASREEAARSGLPPECLLIETGPDGLITALAAGFPVLVDLPDGPAAQPEEEEPPGAGALAVAALSGWLGAAVVRTRYPLPVRRALDLTDSVRGVRPPARTVRGLA